MSKLMACPFCGAAAPLVVLEIDILDPSMNDPTGVCHAICTLCKAHGPKFNTKEFPSNYEELAREAWNTRAGTD